MHVLVAPELQGVHGIARYVQSYLANLPEGAPPTVVLVGDRQPDRKLPSWPNVEVVYLPFPSGRLGLLRFSLAARAYLKAQAKKEALGVINLHLPPLIPGIFLPRVAPIVVTFHTTYLGMSGKFYRPKQFDSQWGSFSVVAKMLLERYILALADKVIVLTEQGRQEVAAYGYRGPLAAVPNGVDVSRFMPDPTMRKDIDVIFAGRIEKRKGSRPLVHVVKALVAAKPDIRIAIVGHGDDLEFVRAECGSISSEIEFTGKIPFDEMSKYYNRSYLYASTSYYEGLPGTCLEAMAMGLPAVVWRFAFYTSVLIEGRTGLSATPNDIDGFVTNVLALVNDKQRIKNLGAAAQGNVRSLYTWDRVAKALARELSEASV